MTILIILMLSSKQACGRPTCSLRGDLVPAGTVLMAPDLYCISHNVSCQKTALYLRETNNFKCTAVDSIIKLIFHHFSHSQLGTVMLTTYCKNISEILWLQKIIALHIELPPTSYLILQHWMNTTSLYIVTQNYFSPGVSKLRPAKQFHRARKAILSIMKK